MQQANVLRLVEFYPLDDAHVWDALNQNVWATCMSSRSKASFAAVLATFGQDFEKSCHPHHASAL